MLILVRDSRHVLGVHNQPSPVLGVQNALWGPHREIHLSSHGIGRRVRACRRPTRLGSMPVEALVMQLHTRFFAYDSEALIGVGVRKYPSLRVGSNVGLDRASVRLARGVLVC